MTYSRKGTECDRRIHKKYLMYIYLRRQGDFHESYLLVKYIKVYVKCPTNSLSIVQKNETSVFPTTDLIQKHLTVS